jgi:competence protein ComEC
LAEDCTHAAIVITTREAPPNCAALVIDRKHRRGEGALAIYRDGKELRIEAARPPGSRRPWMPADPERTETMPTATSPPRARDATPPAVDLEPGD